MLIFTKLKSRQNCTSCCWCSDFVNNMRAEPLKKKKRLVEQLKVALFHMMSNSLLSWGGGFEILSIDWG